MYLRYLPVQRAQQRHRAPPWTVNGDSNGPVRRAGASIGRVPSPVVVFCVPCQFCNASLLACVRFGFVCPASLVKFGSSFSPGTNAGVGTLRL